MDFQAYVSFVQENIDLLKGVYPESKEDLARYEAELGFALPRSMKWLLSEHGYSMACGIENLEGSVEMTTQCRRSISLPSNVLIINDWNDGGVIYSVADSTPEAEYAIYWGDGSDLYKLAKGEPLHAGTERFADFPAWVADRVRFERENG